MAPAKPQPNIDFHRTGAIQPRPLERQHPIQRAISQGQQFLAGDHRHRAAVSDGFIRRSRRIAVRVFSRNRCVVYRLLPHQHRLLRLVARRCDRVGNPLIPSLQRPHRDRIDRRGLATEQHRLSSLGVLLDAHLAKLFGQMFQPLARAPRLDPTQHLRAQANRHAHARCGPDQQQVDQHLASDFSEQFIHIRRRQQAHPTDHRRHVNEQQRLIAEHQQARRNSVGTERQQLVKLGLGQIPQPLLGMGHRVRQPLEQLLEVVPQRVQRFAESARVG